MSTDLSVHERNGSLIFIVGGFVASTLGFFWCVETGRVSSVYNDALETTCGNNVFAKGQLEIIYDSLKGERILTLTGSCVSGAVALYAAILSCLYERRWQQVALTKTPLQAFIIIFLLLVAAIHFAMPASSSFFHRYGSGTVRSACGIEGTSSLSNFIVQYSTLVAIMAQILSLTINIFVNTFASGLSGMEKFAVVMR